MQLPSLKNLLLPKHGKKLSNSANKRVMLTGYLAITIFFVGIYYLIYDWYQGGTNFLWLYAVLSLTALSAILLMREGRYALSRFLLMSVSLVVVALFSSAEVYITGIDFYYVIICMGSLAIFDFESVWIGIAVSILAILIFVVITIGDIQLMEPNLVYEESANDVFLTNLLVCALTAMLIVYYLVSTSYYSEKEMEVTAEQLKESKRNFELALRGSSAGIWVLEIAANKLYISPQMSRMLGHSGAERFDIDRSEFMSYVHPDDAELVNDSLNRHIENKERFEIECRLKTKDGDYIWVLDTGQAEWDSEGNPIKMVGSIVDITERKKAEQEVYEKNTMLRKTNEELDRFVYSTSHDLRAPLSSVLGLINLIEYTDDEEEKSMSLQLMKERINTLNGFIADIINYSRNTRLEISHEEVVLSEVIDKIFAGLEYFESQKKIHVEKTFPPTLKIKCDLSRLRIILNNLIANAIKYHNLDQKKPWIKIHAHDNSQYIVIEIEDNGQGIADDYQDKIFDMFYRASETSEGSGLGLYIAREMTEKLNGDLSVESTVGKGSVFRLKIPKENNS